MNINGFIESLKIMLYGMGGIFIVTLTIYAMVEIMNKIFSYKNK